MSIFGISEICKKICENVLMREDEGRGDLVRLSHCSRAMSATSCEVLWEVLDSVEPLLNLIPALEKRTVVTEEGIEEDVYDLTHPIGESDLRQFDSYAQHVRALRHQFTSGEIEAFSLLHQHKGAALLPKLQSLDWCEGSLFDPIHQFTPRLAPFLSETLQDLQIDLGRFPTPVYPTLDVHDDLAATLPSLPFRCPRVQRFHITGLPKAASLSFLGGFKELRELELDSSKDAPSLTSETLLAISELPALVALRGLKAFGSEMVDNTPKPGFLSLKDIKIVGADATGIELFFRYLSNLTLHSCSILRLKLHKLMDIVACLGAISTGSSSLLSLAIMIESGPPPGSETPSELAEARYAILRALNQVPAPSLTSLDLSLQRTAAPSSLSLPPITFEEAESMAANWPALESFAYGSTFPPFSLLSLSAFVLRCPSLAAVDIGSLVVQGGFTNPSRNQPTWSIDEIPRSSHLDRIDVRNVITIPDDADVDGRILLNTLKQVFSGRREDSLSSLPQAVG
ncbi:hypothetical protein JAAARDRAFT_207713 [Jaapia argillacea MUCL 33604]|uniref:F-box domain-containing protein n=1 Tax=Jaapia argillacea MUCL 33604 TaxID=933084 RepID=A0A067PRZ2_9AGAM|nr:hypothetical protein JAAARDRAFT_207713 [Jaapia argillacea MUCL 33604]